jgi:hypothetical protein
MAKQHKPSIFQPGRDGKAAAVITKGVHGPATSGDAFKGHHVPGNVARDGAPKVHHATPAHGGMTRRQTNMAGVGGLSHATESAPDASAPSPLDKAAPGKRTVLAKAVPGQRSRTSDTSHSGAPGENHARAAGKGVDHALGAAVLGEAASAPDDRAALAHLGVGSLRR